MSIMQKRPLGDSEMLVAPLALGSNVFGWTVTEFDSFPILDAFVDRGFDPGKLLAIGYGDTRPRTAERTPSGAFDEKALDQNRRVVLRVLEPGADTIPWDTARPPEQ